MDNYFYCYILVTLEFLVEQICAQAAISTTTQEAELPLIETEIFGFRLWMIVGLVLTGLLVIIIVLCCVFDCRIPRTKQEIEKDFERRLLAKKMSKKMDTIKPGQNIRITKMPNMRMMQYANQAKLLASSIAAMKRAASSTENSAEPITDNPATSDDRGKENIPL